MRQRLSIVLSATALVVAVFGVTPLGQAAGAGADSGWATAKGMTLGSLEAAGVIRGPRGPRGLRGARGPAGPAGPQGALGPAGTQGPAGAAGAKGDPGAKGDQGAPGAAGPGGPAGAEGQEGEPGPAGPQGPIGATGLKGDPGVKGDPGAKGDQGAQGAAGPAGAQGPSGAPGSPGADGRSFVWRGEWVCSEQYTARDVVSYQGTAWIVPDGTGGSSAPTKVAAPPTCAGPVPPNAPWQLLAQKGDTGAQGAQGDAGPQGAQGDQGLQGLTGAKGDPGTNGTNGAQGPKGETGATGPQGPAGTGAMWASLNANGTVVAKSSGFVSVEKFAPGRYRIHMDRSVHGCALIATLTEQNVSSISAEWAFPVPETEGLTVRTWNGYGTFGPNYFDAAFSLAIFC